MHHQPLSPAVHPEHHVFTFCGHVADEEAINLKSGYAVAVSPQIAIQSMQEFGFTITAISSLSEIRETLAILELIASRSPEVEPNEFLDLYPENLGSYPDDKVFTFIGRYEDSTSPYSKMGFAVAPSCESMTTYLQSHQFAVQSFTSLADLRAAANELQLIALGTPGIDDCGYVNLKN